MTCAVECRRCRKQGMMELSRFPEGWKALEAQESTDDHIVIHVEDIMLCGPCYAAFHGWLKGGPSVVVASHIETVNM